MFVLYLLQKNYIMKPQRIDGGERLPVAVAELIDANANALSLGGGGGGGATALCVRAAPFSLPLANILCIGQPPRL